MFGPPFCGVTLWWIFPLLMIVLCIVICGYMMRGRAGGIMCWPGSCGIDRHSGDASDSALDALNKRYAQGEINKEEYKEKKSAISRHN